MPTGGSVERIVRKLPGASWRERREELVREYRRGIGAYGEFRRIVTRTPLSETITTQDVLGAVHEKHPDLTAPQLAKLRRWVKRAVETRKTVKAFAGRPPDELHRLAFGKKPEEKFEVEAKPFGLYFRFSGGIAGTAYYDIRQKKDPSPLAGLVMHGYGYIFGDAGVEKTAENLKAEEHENEHAFFFTVHLPQFRRFRTESRAEFTHRCEVAAHLVVPYPNMEPGSHKFYNVVTRKQVLFDLGFGSSDTPEFARKTQELTGITNRAWQACKAALKNHDIDRVLGVVYNHPLRRIPKRLALLEKEYQ